MNTKKTAKTAKKEKTVGELRKTVQEFRNKATLIARMFKVNEYLKRLFEANRNLTDARADAAKVEKDITGDIYDAKIKLAGVKNDDPRAEEKRAKLQAQIDSLEKDKESVGKKYAEAIENLEKKAAEIEEKIEKVEKGEIKMSIDEVNSIADDLIAGSYSRQ